MVKVDLTGPIKATFAGSGTSASGNKYAYAVIKAQDGSKDKRQIKIWANNPESVNIANGDYIKVSNITNVAYGATKNKDGAWQDAVTINCDIERMESEFDVPDFNADTGEFAQVDFGNDDELPF